MWYQFSCLAVLSKLVEWQQEYMDVVEKHSQNISTWVGDKASVFTQIKIKRIRNTVMKLNKQKATFFLSKFNE